MNEVPTYIENHSKLTDAFGYWPSFHDSPVFTFNVTDEQIDLVLQVWEMTPELDEKGFFILKNHRLAHFRFQELSDVSLRNPDLGNILFELSFSPVVDFTQSGYFSVDMDSVVDSPATFNARRGRLVDLSPCDSQGTQIGASIPGWP